MKKRFVEFFLTYLLILLSCQFLSAEQTLPFTSSGLIKFEVDIVQFEHNQDSTRLEIPYAVHLVHRSAVSESPTAATKLKIEVKFVSQSGDVLHELFTTKHISLYDTLNPSQHTTYIDLINVNLPPGVISMQMTVYDSLSGKKGELAEMITVRNFDQEFSLSDPYYVSYIQRASGNSVFEKHGIMMVPQPSRLFFTDDSTDKFFVYYEINNLSYLPDEKTFYSFNISVTDISGSEIYRSSRDFIKITGSNTSRIEPIPLRDFISGIYYLHIDVTDLSSQFGKKIKSYFQVIREDEEKPDLLPMSEAEEQKYLDQIKYIVSKREMEIYNQLNPQGKQQFLLQFWKSRDPDPTTITNEFMVEHFRRMAFADQEFKGGIKSNMGRIYIKYGEPVDIERRPAGSGSAQVVEIWNYALNGRTEFVFVDLRGDGDYFLVHSNHPDEYQNPNWQQDIK